MFGQAVKRCTRTIRNAVLCWLIFNLLHPNLVALTDLHLAQGPKPVPVWPPLPSTNSVDESQTSWPCVRSDAFFVSRRMILYKVLKSKVIRMISSTVLQTVPKKFIQTTSQNEVLHILFSLLTFQWFRAKIDRHRTKDFAHVVFSQTHMARTTHMLPGINLSQPKTLVLPWDARHCIAGRTQTRAQGRECQKPSSAMDVWQSGWGFLYSFVFF